MTQRRSPTAATPEGEGVRLARYSVSRVKAGLFALVVAVGLGWTAATLDIDLEPRLGLVGWVVAAILLTVVLHEGVHGLAARLLGHHPIFGLSPPLVYVTFATRMPRDHLIVIALAPLIALDLVFAAAYLVEALRLLAALCFMVNTLGATADLWVSLKLLGHERAVWAQDTLDGVEVWTRG